MIIYDLHLTEGHYISDMGLDKMVIGLMAIKDLFFDAFAISKVLIIVLLRVAWYTWKEEI